MLLENFKVGDYVLVPDSEMFECEFRGRVARIISIEEETEQEDPAIFLDFEEEIYRNKSHSYRVTHSGCTGVETETGYWMFPERDEHDEWVIDLIPSKRKEVGFEFE